MLIYGSSIPEYETHAREVREMCEKMFPVQKEDCRANYDHAIADGRKQSSPPAPPPPTYVPSADDLRKRADEDAALLATQTADCQTNLATKVAEYKKLMAERQYWPATLALQACANALGDQKINAMVADAELKHLKKEIDDTKNLPFDRIRFINTLMRDYPSQGVKYKALLDKLEREQAR